MSHVAAPAAPARGEAGSKAVLLGAGLALALALRVEVSGGDGTSLEGGIAFAGVAIGLSLLAGWRPIARGRAISVLAGIVGAAVLCAWPVAERLGGGPHAALTVAAGSRSAFAAFTLGTLVVVTGEEVLIRGALWQACSRALGGAPGDWLAIAAGAIAFALIHVPWYGWGILPLDVAVGLWLGALRLATGGLTAPWTAHTGADLATWWLL